jgi:hypothetical protein
MPYLFVWAGISSWLGGKGNPPLSDEKFDQLSDFTFTIIQVTKNSFGIRGSVFATIPAALRPDMIPVLFLAERANINERRL